MARLLYMTICICLASVFYAQSLPEKRSDVLSRYMKAMELHRQANGVSCSLYMDSCIPGKTKCCGDLKCLNFLRGYCLYPLESCSCEVQLFTNMDESYR
ncbi:hypothetical protein CHS0354_025951 [Potamilus streckersoni]|uniref:Uncharacterized protein n=1 Tax=Potamilus streckersoni TaxID=2493646 RepID=A0AAE0W6Y3_9BIVA|nr:hypothetical protein CHS0354_025951 [Potamilus streckersoni]